MYSYKPFLNNDRLAFWACSVTSTSSSFLEQSTQSQTSALLQVSKSGIYILYTNIWAYSAFSINVHVLCGCTVSKWQICTLLPKLIINLIMKSNVDLCYQRAVNLLINCKITSRGFKTQNSPGDIQLSTQIQSFSHRSWSDVHVHVHKWLKGVT